MGWYTISSPSRPTTTYGRTTKATCQLAHAGQRSRPCESDQAGKQKRFQNGTVGSARAEPGGTGEREERGGAKTCGTRDKRCPTSELIPT